MLRSAFEEFDATKSGKVKPADFRKALAKFGIHDGVNPILRKFQTHADGGVEYRSFLKFFEEMKSTTSSRRPVTSSRLREDVSAPVLMKKKKEAQKKAQSPEKKGLRISTTESGSPKTWKRDAVGLSPGGSRVRYAKQKIDHLGLATEARTIREMKQYQRRLGSLFKNMDPHGLGQIDVHDFEIGCETAGMNPHDVAVRNLMDSCREGGKVDYRKLLKHLDDDTHSTKTNGAEFPVTPKHRRFVASRLIKQTPMYQTMAEAFGDEHASIVYGKTRELLSRFKEEDPHGHGSLSKEAFGKALHEVVGGKISEETAQSFAESLETDAVHHVDYLSFVGSINASMSQANVLSPERSIDLDEGAQKPMGVRSVVADDGSLKRSVETSSCGIIAAEDDFDEKHDLKQPLLVKKSKSISGSRHRPGALEREDSVITWKSKMADPDKQKLDRAKDIVRAKVFNRTSKLSDVFRSFDTDGNGTVDYDEFQNGLDSLGVDLSREEMNLLIREVDQDGDGQIDYVEFSTALSDEPDESVPAPTVAERRVFFGGRRKGQSVYDEQMKGHIFGEETDQQRRQRYLRRTNIFKMLDSEESPFKTGSSSHEEVQIRKLREEIALRAEYKTEKIHDLFREFDVNHDGILTMNEFRTGLSRLGVDMSDDKFKVLARVADADGNGEIDYGEFVRVMRLEDSQADPYAASSLKTSKKQSVKVRFSDETESTDVLNQKEEGGTSKSFLMGTADGTPKTKLRSKSRVSETTEEKISTMTSTERADLRLRRKVVDQLLGKDSKVSELFRRLDENHDGAVSHSEFRRGLRGLGVNLTVPEFERLLSYVDADHDGEIDYAEFQRLMVLEEDSHASQLKQDGALPHQRSQLTTAMRTDDDEMETIDVKTRKKSKALRKDLEIRRYLQDRLQKDGRDVRSLFLAFDVNRDGVVSPEELRQGLEGAGVVMSDYEFGKLVERFDADGNGAVDYTEFANIFEEPAGEEVKKPSTPASSRFLVASEEERRHQSLFRNVKNLIQQKRKRALDAFRLFDKNGDGVVSREEFGKTLEELGLAVPEADLSLLVDRFDTDKNGTVDYQEFQNFCSTGPLQEGETTGPIAVLPSSKEETKITGSLPTLAPPRERVSDTALFVEEDEDEKSSLGGGDDGRGESVASKQTVSEKEDISKSLDFDDAAEEAMSMAVEVGSSLSGHSISTEEGTSTEQGVESALSVDHAAPPVAGRHRSTSILSPDVVVRERMRGDLLEKVEHHPIRIRESFRAVDRSGSGLVSETNFRKAIDALEADIPEYLMNRAVDCSRDQDTGMCDYGKFLRALDVAKDIPDDDRLRRRSLIRSAQKWRIGNPDMLTFDPTGGEQSQSRDRVEALVSPRRRTVPKDHADLLLYDPSSYTPERARPSRRRIEVGESEERKLRKKRIPVFHDTQRRRVNVITQEEISAGVLPSKGRLMATSQRDLRPLKDKEVARHLLRVCGGKTSTLMENLSGFDPSNTGKLTHARMEKFLRRMGVKLSEDRSEALLRSLDPQGTGHIDVSSFAFSVKAADFSSGPSGAESSTPLSSPTTAALRELHGRFGSTPPSRGFDIVKHDTPGKDKLFASKRRVGTPETTDISVKVPKCKITDLEGSHLKRPSRVFTGEGEIKLLPEKRKPFHRQDTDMFDPSLPYQHGFEKSPAKRPTTAPPETRLREVIRDKIYQVGSAKEAFEKLIHASKGHATDGKLSVTDLQKGLHDMNVNITDRQARRLLASCGSEDGRTVTYDKFASHIFDSPMHTLPKSSSTTSVTSPSLASMRHIRPVHSDSGDIISHTEEVVNSPRLLSPPSQRSSGNILAWE
eukprot:TRINITY_DN2459_c0_g1_i1.p1 TRINITY_DN2459_c0_g1~~TRINITY_DN2459_c0_g1_i1.p1  ORF type:complete len:1822 (-),score=519.58 TRINITY_DN2459_c0_g1_i1:603-6068(-)